MVHTSGNKEHIQKGDIMRKGRALLSMAAILTVFLLSGCMVSGKDTSGQSAEKAGEGSGAQTAEGSSKIEEDFAGLSLGWPETGSQAAPSPELLEEGERMIISEVDLDLEISPQDTVDMVEKLKTLVAEHGGYLSALSSSQYDFQEEEEESDDSTGEKDEDGLPADRNATLGEEEAEGSEYDLNDDYGYDDYDYDYWDYYYGSASHWTEASILIPENQADEFIKKLTQDYEVIDRLDEMEDYTTVYQNLVGRIKALEEEEQRLILMLEEARLSGKGRLADEESGFLEKMMRLENNLWMTRDELDHYRYGSVEDSYYSSYYSNYFEGASLWEFDERRGKTLIEVDIYVAEER